MTGIETKLSCTAKNIETRVITYLQRVCLWAIVACEHTQHNVLEVGAWMLSCTLENLSGNTSRRQGDHPVASPSL